MIRFIILDFLLQNSVQAAQLGCNLFTVNIAL